MKPTDIISSFEAQADSRPAAEAVRFGESALTYGELEEQANRLAHYLKRKGVGPESVVGLCVERSLHIPVGVLGILKAGAVAVTFSHLLTKYELSQIMADCRPNVLFTTKEKIDLLLETIADGHETRIFTEQGAQSYHLLLEKGDSDFQALERSRHDTAAILYTGGTTATPKGAMLSHENIQSALFNVATGQVTRLWFQKNMQTWLNSSVLWQGYSYGPNDYEKALTCVRRSTGGVVWTQSGFGNGSVTLADGKLIILSQAGQLCIAEASPAGYQEIGRGRILTGKCWSVPVLANGKIYARNAAGNLVCVKLETTGPRVDAGSSIITWLEAGTTTVDLSGAVADDTGDVTTILWSVISSPPGSTVDIANDSAAITTATFAETGLYVLELYAIDATAQEGSDRMEVGVYADSCEAAKNNPINAYVAPLYDFDNDCIETFNDFAMFAVERLEIETFNDFAVFAAEWLEDESLTTDVIYDAGKITLPID